MMDYTFPGRIRWSTVNDDDDKITPHDIRRLNHQGMLRSIEQLTTTFAGVTKSMRQFGYVADPYVIQEEP